MLLMDKVEEDSPFPLGCVSPAEPCHGAQQAGRVQVFGAGTGQVCPLPGLQFDTVWFGVHEQMPAPKLYE